MPGLGAAKVSLRDYPSGANVVVFDIDPSSYSPFVAAIRGSSTKVLDGTVVHQFFGLRQEDLIISVQGSMTEYATVQDVWTKYRQGGGGVVFEWRDWFPNRFKVIFSPGNQSFTPVPIIGSCTAFTFTMSLTVLSVIEWFGGDY